MAIENLTGSEYNDYLDGGDGENRYEGMAGDDWINGADGENTIVYNLGDGIDTISYVPPRSYQFAGFLEEVERALAEDSLVAGTRYSNSYFSDASWELLNRLPESLRDVLADMVSGTVDGAAAGTAFTALRDWINTPVTNVVEFGAGITLADLTAQAGATSSFGAPATFSVTVDGNQGVVFSMVGPDLAAAGSTPAEIPPMDITFRFADGTTATLAEVLAQSDDGVAGESNGSEASEVMSGSLADDQIFGNGGDDLIDGRAGMDYISGGSGNDVIAGGAGVDLIYGDEGDDVISGGGDGAMVGGGTGNDVYLFNVGDGLLLVDNTPGVAGSEVDTLSFGAGVTTENVVAYVEDDGTLKLMVGGASDMVQINWYVSNDPYSTTRDFSPNPDQAISRVQFIDARGRVSVFDMAGLMALPEIYEALRNSTVDNPVQLFSSARGSEYDLTESVPAAGGAYAVSYATTGILFETPPPNHRPAAALPIGDQVAVEGQPWSVTLPDGAFTDADGDSLAYSAVLDGGAELPAWLQFNSQTLTFSGTPDDAEVAQGNLAIRVTAADGRGGVASQTFTLAVQGVNDAPQAAASDLSAQAVEDSTFSFSLPAGFFSDADLGDVLNVSADPTDMPAWLSFDPASMTFSGTPTNDDVGGFSVTVTATDSGGLSTSTEVAISVANTNDAPTLDHAIADQTAAEDAAFSVTVPAGTFGDVDAGDVLTLSASALPEWLTFDPASGTFSGTAGNGDVGNVSVTVTATDSTGASVSSTFGISVANTNDAPTLDMAIADQVADEGSAFSFTLPAGSFTDIDNGDVLTLTASMADGSELPSWLTFDAANGTFSGTPGWDDAGNLSVRVTATDGSGASAHDDFDLAVNNVNTPPVVAHPIGDLNADEDTLFTYTLQADVFRDLQGDDLVLSASLADGSPLPAWLSFDRSTGTFSGLPGNADVGALDLRVTASEAAGGLGKGRPGAMSASTDFTLRVANTNDAPTLDHAIADQTAAEDAAFSVTVPAGTFGDVDAGDVLTLSASALPEWLTFDAASGTFSGTAGNGDVGNVSVTVTATDSAGVSVSSTFGISVANTNDAPTLDHAIADQTAAEDAAFSFTVPAGTFGDVDAGDVLTLSASALPEWLTFDAASGTFSGTAGNGDVGNVSVTVTATDSAGVSVSSTFGISVANTNDAPEVVAPLADQTAQQGQLFSMTLPADAFRDIDPGDSLAYRVTLANGDALPTWLHYDPVTRKLSGTPAASAALDLKVIATDGSGASAFDVFALTVESTGGPPAPDADRNLRGSKRDDTLNGGSGNDTLSGGGGKDVLNGGAGNDTFSFYRDSTWHGKSRRTHNGSPGVAGTGAKVSIAGMRRSYDIFNGGDGVDTLLGTGGADAILLDDPSGRARIIGPRLSSIEVIDAGDGDDLVDLTSRKYTYGDVTIKGGTGDDTLWSSSGNDALYGDSGNDSMDGGAGNDYLSGGTGRDTLRGGDGVDLLQGGSNDDTLSDAGSALLDAGSGNDTIIDGARNSMIIGGSGNDTIRLGGGSDVIAFNRGDGSDVIESGNGGSATLSLGGKIRIQDLVFRRSGQDLVLETGNHESITFEDWYRGRQYQAVQTLQLITSGMSGPSGLHDDAVERFNFRDLVANGFDKRNPGLSKWALTNGLAGFDLGGSSDMALGGDLAYQYGTTGSLAGIAVSAAQNIVGASDFGNGQQRLQPLQGLQEGLVKLV